jgi:hypothetical protein
MIAAKTTNNKQPNWEVQKGKLRTRFPKLTDEDLNFDESQKAEMFSKLEIKLALTSEELQVIIETL